VPQSLQKEKTEIKKQSIPKFVVSTPVTFEKSPYYLHIALAAVHFGKHAGYVASYVCFSTTQFYTVVLYIYKTSGFNPRPIRFFREAYFCSRYMFAPFSFPPLYP